MYSNLCFLGMAGYNPFEERPKLTAWYERVKEETSPYYKEAHVVVESIIEQQKLSKL